ncbi:SGF29 tudor-like domain-containing protein [Crassisporium funariophilum]|nr:SGF29 tudor-like domain-containing protein [Crassisporium funariophilum]
MDSRRRGMPTRPASSEEVECWSHAADSLKHLSTIYANSATLNTIDRVNRLLAVWPTDDTLPADGLTGLQTSLVKLSSGLTDIRDYANNEVKAIDDAIERVGVLIALRKATESLPSEKRNKRPRAPSPSGTPLSVSSGASNIRSMSITLPPRTNSVGPHTRDARTNKKDAISKQQLLQGRKVVFRPPNLEESDNNNTWILAVVTRFIGPDKHGGKYEVQDAEPQDDGNPGAKYIANLKAILPLPDPEASPGSPTHLSCYPEFPVGSTVMALYPDTSCFYRAVVIATPAGDRASPSSKYTPVYKVKFEDDEDMQHPVSAFWVVEFPRHLLPP